MPTFQSRLRVFHMALHFTRGRGSLSGAAGVVGTGVMGLLPEQRWVGAILIAIGVLLFVFDVHIEHGRVEVGALRGQSRGPRVIALYGIIFSSVLLVGFTAAYFLLPSKAAVPGASDAAIARLAEMGWTVKSEPDSISFQASGKNVPSFEESANF